MPTPGADERGLGTSAKQVAEHASAVARLEVELASLELKRKVANLGLGIGLAIGAALFLLYALGFGLAAGAAALALVVAALLLAAIAYRHWGDRARLGVIWFAAGASISLFTGRLSFALGIALALALFMRRAGITLRLRDRFRVVHDFLARKWYFDELYDAIFVRPTAAFGRFGRSMIESALVQGLLIGGASGIVRGGTAFARAIQTGALRAYALMLMIGLGGLALYFLIVSS